MLASNSSSVPLASEPTTSRSPIALNDCTSNLATDARKLAKQMGLNPNRWFQNVEKAMLLLEQPKYAKRARHGYCRATQPVAYVASVRRRYDAFRRKFRART